MNKNHAILKADSPFFPIFREGKLPIKNVFKSTKVQLEGSDEMEAYLLDWSRCTMKQRIEIADRIAKEFGTITPSDFQAWMNTSGGELPIRVSSTVSSSLAADMRSFL